MRECGLIPKVITKDQAKDTGMAMVLICLLIGYFAEIRTLVTIAICLLVIDMVWVGFYRPAAKVWFGLAHIMGTIISKVILGVLFYVLVTPVGLIRRLCGKDTLQLKKWESDNRSVFTVRGQTFESSDIETPY